jgi:predicted secreted hydrolase
MPRRVSLLAAIGTILLIFGAAGATADFNTAAPAMPPALPIARPPRPQTQPATATIPTATAPLPSADSAGPALRAPYASVTRGKPLLFPADYGSHPEFRTEWWYATGWLTTQSGAMLGFQVTFFRTRPDIAQENPSAFTPRQLIVVHCAISDPQRGKLWQDQRIRRAGLGLAEAAIGDTDVWADDWHLKRDGGVYRATIAAADFSLLLDLTSAAAPLLNGQAGFSRKGPGIQSASYYYSQPHLSVTGVITRAGGRDPVQGEAWLDHEWSSEYLDSAAVGWEWIGINLDDGGALMAFRIRDAQGDARWAGGTLQGADGGVKVLEPADITFSAGRTWVSPRTGTRYPVEWHVRAGTREFDLKPLLDDQENDTRLTTGSIYWEGAVRAFAGPRPVGRGYLELTGYGERLRLR